MLEKRCKPDFLFAHYTHITPEWLKEQNIKYILSDLDGTLAPQNEEEEERFKDWYQSIEASGTGLIIVSNNKQSRVDHFIFKYKIVGFGRMKKPQTKKIEQELFLKGLGYEHVLFLGDQLLTDIWCGKKLGIKTALVNPIPGKDPITIRIKRIIEKLIIKTWK